MKSLNFSPSFKFSCNTVVLHPPPFFLIPLMGGRLFLTTAVKRSVLFIVTTEYSDYCVLLQSINTLKLNGAFHISQKLKTMALHKL